MVRQIVSRRALRRHQLVIERSLADLKAGKKTDHLSSDEVSQMIVGLENRLTEVTATLASPEAQ